METDTIPHEKLQVLQDKIGIESIELAFLEPYQDLFIRRKQEFAEHLYAFFLDIPETKLILDNQRDPGLLKAMWALWFEALFTAKGDPGFVSYLWRIGVRHVEVNLDQRYTNLGFAVVRQFCQRITGAEIPVEQQLQVCLAIDRLLDLCILVETSAYIESTTKCDFEVIKDVADRVRNPATIIGGNVKRLLKKAKKDSKEFKVYETLISENQRLEGMVFDLKTYMNLFQMDTILQKVNLEELLQGVVKRLKSADERYSVVKTNLALDPVLPYVKGDPRSLVGLFYYLIQNAMDAADGKNPLVTITSRVEPGQPYNMRIEIFNTGTPPEAREIEKLFAPFYSTKTAGSGFGLPIARMVVRKHHGKLLMEPVPGEGTRLSVILPVPDQIQGV